MTPPTGDPDPRQRRHDSPAFTVASVPATGARSNTNSSPPRIAAAHAQPTAADAQSIRITGCQPVATTTLRKATAGALDHAGHPTGTHRCVYRPWVPEPGQHLLIDYGTVTKGPKMLG